MARVSFSFPVQVIVGRGFSRGIVARLFRGGVFLSATQKIPASEDPGYCNILWPLKISTEAHES